MKKLWVYFLISTCVMVMAAVAMIWGGTPREGIVKIGSDSPILFIIIMGVVMGISALASLFFATKLFDKKEYEKLDL